VTAAAKGNSEQLLVRVSPETYSALQLAQPFVQRRSMQDLVAAVIEDFLSDLRANDPGFERALVGLRESRARRDGVLSRRTTSVNASSATLRVCWETWT
jgi:hypothetical protein